MLSKLEQPENAESPISVIVSSKGTCLSSIAPLSRLEHTPVVPGSNVIVSIPLLVNGP